MVLINNEPLSLKRQRDFLLEGYPQFDVSITKSKRLICVGVIHPTALSDEYKFRMQYVLSCHSTVTILSPVLLPRSESEPVPHTYKKQVPCVYWPRGLDWCPSMPLVTTIIPWLAEWLDFYEIWRVTGHWYGGGIHGNCALPALTRQQLFKLN